MKILIFLTFCVSFLYSHQTGLSFLELNENKGVVDVIYKKPLSDTRIGDIEVLYPSFCLKETSLVTKLQNGFIIKKYKLICDKTLVGSRIWIKGLVRNDRGILVRYENGDFIKKEILRDKTPFIYLDKKEQSIELSFEYIRLGIFHILSGYDHLLFVLLLFLLSLNLKSLLFNISAFTFSHSITLTCGILGIIYMPPPFIESMIALSIIFLAKELLIEKETFTKKHLSFVTFSFGLLHGFGFSSVLKDIGLPQDEIPLSLFSFNLGIEIGQIIFIIFASLIFRYLKYKNFKSNLYNIYIAYIVGSLASFWFIQRVFSF